MMNFRRRCFRVHHDEIDIDFPFLPLWMLSVTGIFSTPTYLTWLFASRVIRVSSLSVSLHRVEKEGTSVRTKQEQIIAKRGGGPDTDEEERKKKRKSCGRRRGRDAARRNSATHDGRNGI